MSSKVLTIVYVTCIVCVVLLLFTFDFALLFGMSDLLYPNYVLLFWTSSRVVPHCHFTSVCLCCCRCCCQVAPNTSAGALILCMPTISDNCSHLYMSHGTHSFCMYWTLCILFIALLWRFLDQFRKHLYLIILFVFRLLYFYRCSNLLSFFDTVATTWPNPLVLIYVYTSTASSVWIDDLFICLHHQARPRTCYTTSRIGSRVLCVRYRTWGHHQT